MGGAVPSVSGLIVPSPPYAAVADGLVAVDFAELYRENFAFVWRAMRALGVRHADLEDLAQEVFVIAHRRIEEFEGRSKVRTWLFAIAHRVVANYRRHHRRKGGLEPVPETLSSADPGPLYEAQQAEAAAFLCRFLDGLDDGLRAVFVSCVLEEMTAPEAAEALGVKLNTVYSRVRIGRARLREALERLNNEAR